MSNDKTRCSSLGRLGAYRYSAPYKQLVPNQCLTFNHGMSRPGLSDGSCILLISNETPSAGCHLAAKRGDIQKLDSIDGYRDRVTRSHDSYLALSKKELEVC